MVLHVRFSFLSFVEKKKRASVLIIFQVSHAFLPFFPYSSRRARAAAHLLQGLQGRRAPAHRSPGCVDRRHPHRPCGAFPRKCSERECRLFFCICMFCFFPTMTRTLSLTSLHATFLVDPHLRQPPPVRLQGLQLDPPHCHHCGPAGRHQRPCHFCPHHQGHLWIHR